MSKTEKSAGEFCKKSSSLEYELHPKIMILIRLHNFLRPTFRRFFGSIIYRTEKRRWNKKRAKIINVLFVSFYAVNQVISKDIVPLVNMPIEPLSLKKTPIHRVNESSLKNHTAAHFAVKRIRQKTVYGTIPRSVP